ncbi:MAG: hypothetical protein EXX96DRAFT_458729, partial [Benjaminiella poitrasii]
LFPEASEWLDKVHQGQAEHTVSAEGFLKLILILRVTFLQDSVFMQKICPDNPIWKHKLFTSQKDLEFKSQLETSSQAEESQEDVLIRRVIPIVERRLANIEDQNRQTYEKLAEMLNRLIADVSDISTGRA